MKSNINHVLLFFIVFSIYNSSLSQTFYRSVADIDSFAYVTIDDKLLVMKRDSLNELELKKIISFDVTHRQDNFNSAIIINDYLLVSSKDSIYLFSILDRENPIELNKINVNNILLLNKFGSYCLVYTNSEMPLLSIENNSLQFKTTFPNHNFDAVNPYILTNHLCIRYPYIYKIIPGILLQIMKYDSLLNQLNNVTDINAQPNYYFNGVVSNSTELIALEAKYLSPPANYSLETYKYSYENDTLVNRTYQCLLTNIEYPPPLIGWSLNDTFGIKLSYPSISFQLFRSINPCGELNTNISTQFPDNPYVIKNSVYTLGSSIFNYLYNSIGNSLTFKQFVMPTLPSIPSLIYPTNNQLVSDDSINFYWSTSSPNVTNYLIEISKDSLFTDLMDSVVTDTILTITELESNQTYFWRVKAQNLIGWSNFSELGLFATSLTGIDTKYQTTFEYNLEQNFPNPFNPTTKISWQSPVSGWQTLKVYDVLGKEVATLVNEYKPRGRYEVEFDASHLSSGVYFYQLRAGEYVEIKKMILMK